ncbi:MAG: hypothetical protein RDU25_02290 [Patescibacteria group bacterium]|nr:hypothetical protein [Patescibacteria group bacterium]
MPSVTDLNRYHTDAEKFVRQADSIIEQYGARGGRRGDPAKLKSELQTLAREVQSQTNINRENLEFGELNDIFGALISKSETKQGPVFFALKKYTEWKNARNKKLEQRVQDQEEAERLEAAGIADKEKKAKAEKAKKAAEAKAAQAPKTIEDKTVGIKPTEQETEEAEEEEKEKTTEVQEEETETEPESAVSREQTARAGAASVKSVAAPTPVAASAAAVTAAAVAVPVMGATAGAVAAAVPSRQQAPQVSTQTATTGKAERRASTSGEVTAKTEATAVSSDVGEVVVTARAEKKETPPATGSVEVKAEAQTQRAAQPIGGQISVSAQSKVERAAAGRGISAGAEAMIFATPAQAAAIYASIATPVQNQVSQLEGYIKGTNRNFNPKQFNSEIKSASNQLNQLQNNIKSMPAAQKKTAEYKNLTQQVGAASTQLNNFNALPQVRNIEKDASPEALRGVAPALPALNQAIGAPAAGGAVSAPASQPAASGAAAALGEIGKGMEAAKQALQEERNRLATGGGEAPEATGEAPKLPSGVAIKRQPLRMPNIEPTRQAGLAGAPSSRAALSGDTPITDQSLGLGDEPRASVIELPSRSTAEGQVMHAGSPMFGGAEEEEEDLAGGGMMVADAMELQRAKAQARRMQAASQSFMSGAAVGGGLEAMPGEEESYDVDLGGLGDEEDEEAEPGEEPASGAQGAVDRAMQMAKDKVMDKAKQKVQDEVVKQLEKAGMKVAAKTTGATARVGIESAEAGTAPESVGITLLLLILQLNVQLVLKYIFKSFGTVAQGFGVDKSPGAEVMGNAGFASEAEKTEGCLRGFVEQSFIEDVLTIFLDCLMCVNFLFMPPFCICTIILIVIIAGIGAVGSVVGLDKIISSISSLF